MHCIGMFFINSPNHPGEKIWGEGGAKIMGEKGERGGQGGGGGLEEIRDGGERRRFALGGKGGEGMRRMTRRWVRVGGEGVVGGRRGNEGKKMQKGVSGGSTKLTVRD